MQVKIENGLYRGNPVQGTFELVQDYTAFNYTEGKVRRNGNGGLGFLKIRHNGHLVGCVKPVGKVTVPAEGEGYTLVESRETVVPASESVARFLESAGWNEKQVSQTPVTSTLAELAAKDDEVTDEELEASQDEDYSAVETIVQVMVDIAALETAVDGLTGTERANARKTLGRRKDKLAALIA